MKPLDALRALGPGSPPPDEVKQRVAGALSAALEMAAAASLLAKPLEHASVPPVRASFLGSIASSKILTIAAGIWVAGAITGAALYRALRTAEVRVVYVERPAAPPLVAAPEPSGQEPGSGQSGPSPRAEVASGAPLGQPLVEQAKGRPGAEPSSELAQERALLDVARADAAQGEAAQALGITEQHRRKFPRGRLSEEREALAIRALLSLGRAAQARERAQAFRSTYPNSFLTPALESALAAP
jgi:hypothetical protein